MEIERGKDIRHAERPGRMPGASLKKHANHLFADGFRHLLNHEDDAVGAEGRVGTCGRMGFAGFAFAS